MVIKSGEDYTSLKVKREIALDESMRRVDYDITKITKDL